MRQWLEEEKNLSKGNESGGQFQVQSEYDQPVRILEKITKGKEDEDGKGGSGRMLQKVAKDNMNMENEVKRDG